MLSQIFPVYDLMPGNELASFESCLNICKALAETCGNGSLRD